jgi:pyrophosphatase PpaX
MADSLSGIRAVLFDIDGTLVDTLPALIPGLGDAFEKYAGHRPSDEVIRGMIGMPLSQQMRLFQLHEPSQERLKEMIDYAIGRFEHYKDRERVFGPAVQALIRLSHEDFRIGLVTSKSQVELTSFLDRFEAAAFVDVAVCASDVEKPKPHADCALLACERLAVAPGEAIFIGDSIFDMQCAQRAGIAAYAVTYGAGDEQALLAENPARVFKTPEELYEWAYHLSEAPCLDGRS